MSKEIWAQHRQADIQQQIVGAFQLSVSPLKYFDELQPQRVARDQVESSFFQHFINRSVQLKRMHSINSAKQAIHLRVVRTGMLQMNEKRVYAVFLFRQTARGILNSLEIGSEGSAELA